MDLQKLQNDASVFLAMRLGCESKHTTQLATTLLQNGVLQWNGAGFALNESAPCLLQLAPGLVSWGALETMAQAERNSPFGNGRALGEMSRRMHADPSLSAIGGHIQYSESSTAGGNQLTDSDLTELENFCTRNNAAREADAAEKRSQLPGIRNPQVAANVAIETPKDHPDGTQARNNLRELERSLMTDFQRGGPPPLDAA